MRFARDSRWIVAAFALAAPALALAGEDALPRYKFQVGQELSYAGSSRFDYDNGGGSSGSHLTKNTWTFWVLKKNDDGSHRLLARQGNVFVQEFSKEKSALKDLGKLVTGKPIKAPEPEPTITLAYFDIFDDGRILPNPSFGYQFNPSTIFPPMPKDANELAKGWESTQDEDRTAFSAVAGADPGSFVFDSVQHSAFEKIYAMTQNAKVFFDRSKGLVNKIESESAQGYGFQGKGKGTTEGKPPVEGTNTKAMATDADTYFAAKATYEKQTEEASTSADADAVLKKAVESLKQIRETLHEPLFKDQIDKDIASHESMVSYYVQGAKDRVAVMGKPAPGFEIKDMQGQTHTLDQYKGKVVVLDFWYRGCGWCVKAMPQMKQVTDDFRGKPVAVLGMNTDRDDKDAQFVIDAMGLNYTTLKATGIPEKFHVRGFPTLIIIDKEGNVADIHVGYSKTLRQDVGKSIQKLLEK